MHQSVTRQVGDNQQPDKDIVDGSKAYVETNSKKPTNTVMKEDVNNESIRIDSTNYNGYLALEGVVAFSFVHSWSNGNTLKYYCRI